MIKAYRRTSFRYDFIRENHEKEINFSFKFVSQEGKDKKKPHFKGLNLHFEFFNIKFSEVLTYIKERFHTKQDEAWMFNEVNEDILNQYAYHIEAKKGALDYIKKCASENKKMAVLTSNTRALSEKVLDRLGMLEYMENVYSADELKMSKREVDIYEYVLKDLNTTAESAIVFEDSMYAINTARSLNIECIGLVNPNNQKVFEKNHVKTIVDFTELC